MKRFPPIKLWTAGDAVTCGLALTVLLAVGPAVGQSDSAHNSGTRTSVLRIEKDHGVLFVRDFCSHGLQFIAVVQSKTASNNGSGGVSVVQVLGADGKPMQCAAVPARPN
jgi:hypothetical protein